jgi:tripartite-type tricarboxylate transporter receptor subunit TctC
MKLSVRAIRLVMACTVLCISGLAAVNAQAQQDFPAKPITLLIPFPPGTGNDIVGRLVGNRLSECFGQQVVADYRAGASGNIEVNAACRAVPDGYTLAVASTSSVYRSPAELDAFLTADTAMWSRLVKDAGIKPQ